MKFTHEICIYDIFSQEILFKIWHRAQNLNSYKNLDGNPSTLFT